jgi:hypothetical protein
LQENQNASDAGSVRVSSRFLNGVLACYRQQEQTLSMGVNTMPAPEQVRIEQLEKEVKILNVKLEALVNYLNAPRDFGPPDGRSGYDAMVKSILEKANLLV